MRLSFGKLIALSALFVLGGTQSVWADDPPPADDSTTDSTTKTTAPAKPVAPPVNPANRTYKFEKTQAAIAKETAQAASAAQAKETENLKKNPALLATLQNSYTCLSKGQFDKALKMLVAAVKKDKDSITARRYLAYALLKTGSPQQAIEQLLFVAKMIQPSAFDWYTFGESYLSSGDYHMAQESFQDALKINAQYDAARGGLVQSLAGLQNYDEALKTCLEGLRGTQSTAAKTYYQKLYTIVAQEKIAAPGRDNAGKAVPWWLKDTKKETPPASTPTPNYAGPVDVP
jgi:tetratricopeptide (TPR) repeat protein